MDDLLAQLVIEAAELTQQAAEDLLVLDREPGDRARLDSAFRAIHTLKGSVGLFDLAPLQSTLHAAEDVLDTAMKGNAELDSARIDPLLAVIEWVDRCVRHLYRAGSLPADAGEDSASLIRALASGQIAAAGSSIVSSGPVPQWAKSLFEAHKAGRDEELVAIRYAPEPECFFNGSDPVALMATVPNVVYARVSTREEWAAPPEFDPFRSNLIFEALSTAKRPEIAAVFRLIPDQISLAQNATSAPLKPTVSTDEISARTIRVDIARVDDIVTLIGEFLAAKNSMSALVAEAQALDGGLALSRRVATMQHDLGRLIGRLRRAAMDVRVVPLGDTLRRLTRLTRQISAQTGKPIQLDLSGADVEADKTIVDGVYEPLLHIIRNAVDHGIESEDERRSSGKPPKGTISVSARQLGEDIEIQIRDDGRGIDKEQVRSAAVARGVLSAEVAGGLRDGDILDLLFAPGFSTSETVTDLSGRGVGMDAVRAVVRRLGGKVAITSVLGTGTTVTLSLPSSFSVSRVLVVTVAGEQYGVPMEAIAETVRIPAHAIVQVRSGEACVLRDRTIPILRLGHLVGSVAEPRSDELVLVLELETALIGVVVDSIGERFETLLRPPAGLLKAIKGILGTTVLGDGRIVMVLDLEALLT